MVSDQLSVSGGARFESVLGCDVQRRSFTRPWRALVQGAVVPHYFQSFSQFHISDVTALVRGWPSWWASIAIWPR